MELYCQPKSTRPGAIARGRVLSIKDLRARGDVPNIVRAAGRYRFARPVSAVFERDDEQEPTDDGRPPCKGEPLGYSILWDGRDAKLVCGGAMRQPFASCKRLHSRYWWLLNVLASHAALTLAPMFPGVGRHLAEFHPMGLCALPALTCMSTDQLALELGIAGKHGEQQQTVGEL
jgi:hypothetical protein